MAAGLRDIKIRFTGDTSGLDRAAAAGEKSLGGFKEGFKKANDAAVKASAVVVAGAAVIGKRLVDMAAQAEQSLGAVDSVFGANADKVKRWAEGAATNVGLSAHAYREMATTIGAQLKNMGVPMDKVAGKTNGLVKKGADLAAMFGGTTSEAVGALSSLLRGETDPIERYGVSIKEADISARLASMGLDKLEGAAGKTARTQAIMALLTEQTADAQGQFARETDSAAGKAQIAQAQFENLQTELGMKLLPVYTKVMGFISNTVLPVLSRNQGLVEKIALALVGLAGFVLVANGAYKVYVAVQRTAAAIQAVTLMLTKRQTAATVVQTAVTRKATIAQRLMNLALRANPIGIVITILFALGAALVMLWKKSETFRNIVKGAFERVKAAAAAVWHWIKANWPMLLAIITGPIGIAVGLVIKHWSRIKSAVGAAVGWIKGVLSGMWDSVASGARWALNGAIGAINGLISGVNWLIGGFNALPGPDLPSIPSIPYLAEGGIVTGPTLAMIGEAGREAVVPLDKADEFGFGGLGGGVLELHVDLGDGIKRVLRGEIKAHDKSLRRRVKMA